MLKFMAKQTCYAQASLQQRKDFRPLAGVLDPFLSLTFRTQSKLTLPGDVPPTAFFESQVVGCMLTKDRLHAAKRTDDAQCRMCGQHKETLPHLVCECSEVRATNPPPVAHD